jgi:hypothetical protein
LIGEFFIPCPASVLSFQAFLVPATHGETEAGFSSATYTLEKSPDGQIPCGRFPTGMVATNIGVPPLRKAFTSFVPPTNVGKPAIPIICEVHAICDCTGIEQCLEERCENPIHN